MFAVTGDNGKLAARARDSSGDCSSEKRNGGPSGAALTQLGAVALQGGPVGITTGKTGMRFHTVAAAYAVWLLAILIAFYLTHGQSEMAMQIALAAGAIPAALQLLLLGVDWRGLVAPAKMWLALLVIILFSYLVSNSNPETTTRPIEGLPISSAWIPMVYTLNVIFMVVIAVLVAGCPDRRLLRSIAGTFCILCAPFLVYVDLTGTRTWGNRLEANGIASNWWGLMGLTVCLTAFAMKPGPLAVAGFMGGAETILAGSSREDMVAMTVTLMIVIVSYLRTVRGSRLMLVLAGLCATLFGATVLLPYIIDAVGYVGHDVLLVDSSARGIGSGFTGRVGLWKAAVDIWLQHPILGVGFRQNEQFLGGYSAHNAYLAMLVDMGLVGFVWFLILLGASFIAALGIRDQRTRLFVITLIVANVIIGFFDRRIINGGTPYGLFFIMCCSAALADRSLRRTTLVLQNTGQFSTAGSPLTTNPDEAHAH
jgi:O-antigen ligase